MAAEARGDSKAILLPNLNLLWRDGLAAAGLLLTVCLLSFLIYQGCSATLTAAAPAAALPTTGFYPLEQFSDRQGVYRWSSGRASLELPNPGGAVLLEAQLAGGLRRRVTVEIDAGAERLSLPVAPELRVYRLLLPQQHGETLALQLSSPTVTDPASPRQLGVVLGDIRLAGSGAPPAGVLLCLGLVTLLYGLARLAGLRRRPALCLSVLALMLQSGWIGGGGWRSGLVETLVPASSLLAGAAVLGWRAAGSAAPQIWPAAQTRGRGGALRGDWLAVGALIGANLAAFGRYWFTGQTLLPYDLLSILAPWRGPASPPQNGMMSDVLVQYVPWRTLYREALRAGELPFWNPYTLGGMPFFANQQSGVLYPFNLLFLPLSLETGFLVFVSLHVLLTGLGMYVLLRQTGLRPVAALTGALAWSYCGYLGIWQLWLSIPATLAWLPWCLYATSRLLAEGRRRALGLLGLSVALMLLGGHLQFAFYGLLTTGLWALWLASTSAAPWRTRAARLGLCALGVLLGTLTVAVQLVPTLELAARNSRVSISAHDQIAGAIPLPQLAMLILPDVFGDVNHYKGSGNYVAFNGYVGLTSLIFAGLALLHPQRRPARRFFLLVALISLHLVYGGVLNYLFFYLPGYSGFRGFDRLYSIWSLAIAGLVGYGVEAACAAAGWRRRLIGACAATLLLGGAGAGIWVASGLARLLRQTWPEGAAQMLSPALPDLIGQAGWLLAGAGLALALLLPARRWRVLALGPALLIAFDLISFQIGLLPALRPANGYPVPPGIAYLQRHRSEGRVIRFGPALLSQPLPPNTGIMYQIEDLQGYDSFTLDQHNRLLGALEPERYIDAQLFNAPNNLQRAASLRAPLLDLLGAAFVLSAGPLPPDALPPQGHLELAYRGNDLWIYRNPRALPLGFVVGRAEARPRQEQLALMARPDFAPGRQAWLEQAPDLPLDPQARGDVQIVRRSLNTLELAVQVRAAPGQAGLLVIRQNAYPGWRAQIDGADAALLTADYSMQALALPPGRHTVRLVFTPTLFAPLAALAVAALLLTCWLLARPSGART
jgi:hypothetical protein